MRAFVIGNVAVDETIAVDAMPSPGASVLGRETARGPGGKGCNQAVVLARAGLDTVLVAGMGDDSRGDFIRARLAGEAVDARLVTLERRRTDFSVILTTPDGENAIVTTTDCARALVPADAAPALDAARAGDLLLLQGNLSDATTRNLFLAGRAKGLVTAFNPSPLRPFFAGLWPLVDIAFLNRGEMAALAGAEGARRLLDEGVGRVVLTLGSEGALLAGPDGTTAVPATPCAVVDTAGAGDTFMAVALASAGLRATPLDARALDHAGRAAALTAGRAGTHAAFPSAAELAAILSA